MTYAPRLALAPFLVLLSAGVLAQETHLSQDRWTAAGGFPGGKYGSSIGVDGELAVVGAPDVRRAFVRVRSTGVWSDEATLFPTGSPGQGFGQSVAIEGETIVVGAPLDDLLPTQSGAAFVFARSGGSWTQEARLSPGLADSLDRFGSAVDIDGGRIVVGAPGARGHGGQLTGAAFVFERVGGVWTEVERVLHPQSVATVDDFGHSLALDGNELAIGDRSGSNNHGGVNVYAHNGAGWQHVVDLGALGVSFVSEFSHSLDLRDGRLAVGSSADNFTAHSNAGSVYIYERGDGSWPLRQRLAAHDMSTGYRLGSAVALAEGALLVGSYRAQYPAVFAGAAYLFELVDGVWRESALLRSSAPESSGEAGTAVAFTDQGLLIGCPGELDDAGTVRTFRTPLTLPLATAFGYGDGSGTPCPCNNEEELRRGCLNSKFRGGVLVATGSRSVAADDLQFQAASLPEFQTALLFVGDSVVAGGPGLPFGDGLRVVGGNIVRLGVRSVLTARAQWAPGLGASGGWSAGHTRNFQVWYRDPSGPCGTGFNLTQALAVQFIP